MATVRWKSSVTYTFDAVVFYLEIEGDMLLNHSKYSLFAPHFQPIIQKRTINSAGNNSLHAFRERVKYNQLLCFSQKLLNFAEVCYASQLPWIISILEVFTFYIVNITT